MVKINKKYKRIGGIQPIYLPWIGVFEQINSCDLFILYDELQYNQYNWRNRNRIKTPLGWQWLTVPVFNKFGQKIKEVIIDNSRNWRKKHWKSIEQNYRRAPYFKKYSPFIENVYLNNWERLVDIDTFIIKEVANILGIKTPILLSSELKLEDKFLSAVTSPTKKSTERIIFTCKLMGAKEFYEGASGKNYIDEERFQEEGLSIIYQEFQHPVYPQLYGPFIPYLSIIDLLFNCGDKSLQYLIKKSI